jgi:hypothetical protein
MSEQHDAVARSRPTNRRPALAVAAVEVLSATVLVALAVRWWYRGMVVTEFAGAQLFRVDGRWWAAAVLGATVAGLLLIDAVRRVVRVPGPRR